MYTWLMQQSYNKRLHENEMAYEKHGGKRIMEFVVVHHMDHDIFIFFWKMRFRRVHLAYGTMVGAMSSHKKRKIMTQTWSFISLSDSSKTD